MRSSARRNFQSDTDSRDRGPDNFWNGGVEDWPPGAELPRRRREDPEEQIADCLPEWRWRAECAIHPGSVAFPPALRRGAQLDGAGGGVAPE